MVESERIACLLSEWIKSFSWKENESRTDAEMRFEIVCMDCEKKEASLIDERIIKLIVEQKADCFADVYVVESLDWDVKNFEDDSKPFNLHVNICAGIHLAEPGFPYNSDAN